MCVFFSILPTLSGLYAEIFPIQSYASTIWVDIQVCDLLRSLVIYILESSISMISEFSSVLRRHLYCSQIFFGTLGRQSTTFDTAFLCGKTGHCSVPLLVHHGVVMVRPYPYPSHTYTHSCGRGYRMGVCPQLN